MATGAPVITSKFRELDSGKEEEFSLALHLIDQNLFTQLHLDARSLGGIVIILSDEASKSESEFSC